MFKVFFLIHIEIRRVILSSDFELFQNNDFSGVKSENVSQLLDSQFWDKKDTLVYYSDTNLSI